MFTKNKLKLNEDKTEVIKIIKPKCNLESQTNTMNVCGTVVNIASDSVRNLGVIFDQNLSLSDHVSNVIKTCNFHLHTIGKIRPFIDKEICRMLMSSLVSSRLDYCNAILTGSSSCLIQRLQKVQNRAARILFP